MTTWADRQKGKGVRLELTWFAPRSRWKKKHNKRTLYFDFPCSKAGYEAALQAWFLRRTEIDGTRKNAEVFDHHKKLFERVRNWYDAFGVPASEFKLCDQIFAFLLWMEDQAKQPDLPSTIPMGAFCLAGTKRPEFWAEFGETPSGYTLLGMKQYELPSKWMDRLDRSSSNVGEKEPQTIGHWLERYIKRVAARGGKFITPDSAKDRRYKLKNFSMYADNLAHITTIDAAYLEEYHAALDASILESNRTVRKSMDHGLDFDPSNLDDGTDHETKIELSRDTKQDYFAVFRMFVRWCSRQNGCDLIAPKNLDSKEFGFREPLGTGRKRQAKKGKLWSVEEFNKAVLSLPAPYPAYLMLMLNCGFRHVDLSELRWTDLHLEARRIVIQRNKLNQQETAPVISYPLWDKTVELVKQAMSNHKDFVFRNQNGGPVENSIKLFWKRRQVRFGLKGKRLDFIRKTGSTLVAKFEDKLDEFYLGETLSRTAKIHYSFVDGEPCEALDEAIGMLGNEFGFCDAPAKRVTLTKDVIEVLTKAGVDVSKLG